MCIYIYIYIYIYILHENTLVVPSDSEWKTRDFIQAVERTALAKDQGRVQRSREAQRQRAGRLCLG